jgi:hypothetical protein
MIFISFLWYSYFILLFNTSAVYALSNELNLYGEYGLVILVYGPWLSK